jgi:hypothetical protein
MEPTTYPMIENADSIMIGADRESAMSAAEQVGSRTSSTGPAGAQQVQRGQACPTVVCSWRAASAIEPEIDG